MLEQRVGLLTEQLTLDPFTTFEPFSLLILDEVNQCGAENAGVASDGPLVVLLCSGFHQECFSNLDLNQFDSHVPSDRSRSRNPRRVELRGLL